MWAKGPILVSLLSLSKDAKDYELPTNVKGLGFGLHCSFARVSRDN
jgi:hypothetical protein